MKKIFALIICTIVAFTACDDDDDGYSLGDFWIDIATVENPDNNTAFYFLLDDNTRMWTAASDLLNYRPKNGQRILADYTLLSDRPSGSPYDHDVKLNDVYEILTKNIFEITPATQDSIGNDPIEIEDIWVGSNYLNIEFEYKGLNKIHFINLVRDRSKTYNDGRVHLEFRHNAHSDTQTYDKWGIASFDLRSLQNTESVQLVIHSKEYDGDEEIHELTYTPNDVNSRKKDLSFDHEKGQIE